MDMKKPKLVNAKAMAVNHPETFVFPLEDIKKIKRGNFVKVCAEPERFWVLVNQINDDTITGVINNDLVRSKEHKLYCDDIIQFKKDNIYQVLK